jgi:hypothetical protein
MKITRIFLLLSLAGCLSVAGYAQAFCFSKGNNQGRTYNYYYYPLPAVGFVPQNYYAYPYDPVQMDRRYGYEEAVTPSSLPDIDRHRDVWSLK